MTPSTESINYREDPKKLPLIHSHVPIFCCYLVIGVNLVLRVSLLPFPSLDLEFDLIKACVFACFYHQFLAYFHLWKTGSDYITWSHVF